MPAMASIAESPQLPFSGRQLMKSGRWYCSIIATKAARAAGGNAGESRSSSAARTILAPTQLACSGEFESRKPLKRADQMPRMRAARAAAAASPSTLKKRAARNAASASDVWFEQPMLGTS